MKEGNSCQKKNESILPEDDEQSKNDLVENKQVIEALKNRIRQLESGHSAEMKFICLICKVCSHTHTHYLYPIIYLPILFDNTT